MALKLLGRSSVARQLAFAQERAWGHLNFVQTVGDRYANDLGLLQPDGSESPALIVFQREAGEVRLFWASEMRLEMADPGQDPRDAPDMASLWSVLDLTPAGRGVDWYPKLNHRSARALQAGPPRAGGTWRALALQPHGLADAAHTASSGLQGVAT